VLYNVVLIAVLPPLAQWIDLPHPPTPSAELRLQHAGKIYHVASRLNAKDRADMVIITGEPGSWEPGYLETSTATTRADTHHTGRHSPHGPRHSVFSDTTLTYSPGSIPLVLCM
jgi:hypothetical protein